jgi:hypothetical protein
MNTEGKDKQVITFCVEHENKGSGIKSGINPLPLLLAIFW